MATAVAKKPKVETFSELVSEGVGSSFKIDREACVVRGVKLLGIESRNGRHYSPAAISRAKSIYEGVRVNLNHPKESEKHKPRDYEARTGIVRNATEAADGLYGDYHYNPKHPACEQILYDIEHNPSALGFSHVAEICEKKVGGRNVVEEIKSVKSVDLVTDPATTRGVFESLETDEDEMSLESVTLEQLKSSRPDLLTALVTEQANSEAANAVKLELKTVKEELDALKVEKATAAKQANVAKFVNESKLPKEALTELFVESLNAADSDDKIKALIADRKALVGGAKPISRDSLASEAIGDQSKDRESFVRSITKRSRLSA